MHNTTFLRPLKRTRWARPHETKISRRAAFFLSAGIPAASSERLALRITGGQ